MVSFKYRNFPVTGLEGSDPDLQWYDSLLLRLARIYTHSATSTHSLTPRPVPRLTAGSIHALDTNPFFTSCPISSLNLLDRAINVRLQASRGEDNLHGGS